MRSTALASFLAFSLCQASASEEVATQRDTPSPVQISVDTSRGRKPISPYIYGVHPRSKPMKWTLGTQSPLVRIGGNRWTAYNWENNASNAGADYNHQNDSLLSESKVSGEAITSRVQEAYSQGASVIVTVPILPYVAADKNDDGDVKATPDFINKRFVKSVARKGKPLRYPPDMSDGVVYQDEFVSWVEKTLASKGNGKRIFYSLDNEPDLWQETHKRIHPAKPSYNMLIGRSVEYARMIKDVAPSSLVFGPALSGWYGFTHLGGAEDRDGRDFIDAYLAAMKKAEAESGKRVLDVLDVHWYPEATSEGRRVTNKSSRPSVGVARMQSPRSLWDSSFVERSWITNKILGNKPIALLPRLKQQIARSYPGTKLAITEYNYGGHDEISGGIAQADVLGLFAEHELFAACLWRHHREEPFIDAAFAIFKNVDGKGEGFGDTLVESKSSDVAYVPSYASVHPNGSKVVLVVINRGDQERPLTVSVKNEKPLAKVALYRLSAEAPKPVAATGAKLADGALTDKLPPRTVSTYVLTP